MTKRDVYRTALQRVRFASLPEEQPRKARLLPEVHDGVTAFGFIMTLKSCAHPYIQDIENVRQMYKHPMLSVKEAAVLMGCDERWIRERLNQGQLKGEKKSIGLKEKWFVYKGEIDAALARKGVFPSPSAEPKSEQQQSTYFGVEGSVEDIEAIDAQVSDESTVSAGASVAELVRLIANEFAEKLDQQTQLNWQLKRELEDKERQLLLLPDLQKRAEEERKATELKTLETIALQKQITEMEAAAQKARDLEEKVVPELQQRLDQERQTKETELNTLQEKLRQFEEERQEAEHARQKVEELEKAMAALRTEEQAKLEEKDAREKAIQEQLTSLTGQLEHLQQPWWKRWFNSQQAE